MNDGKSTNSDQSAPSMWRGPEFKQMGFFPTVITLCLLVLTLFGLYKVDPSNKSKD